MKDLWDACVVGAGSAGCTAAVQLVREGFRTILVEKEPQIGGLIRHAWRVENCPLLERPESGIEIARLLEDYIKRWGITVQRMTVRSIAHTDDGALLAEGDGCEVRAKAMIVCAGTVPKTLDLAIPNGIEPCFYPCDVPSGAKRVVIIGGGDAAFDYALTLAERNVEAVILVRADRPRALKRLQDEVRSRGIDVCLEAKIIMFEKVGDSIKILLRSKGTEKELAVDALVVAIGRQSARKDIMMNVGFQRSERSGLPMCRGLWLAGDIWRGRIRQMSIAVGDGLAAAMEAAEFLRGQGVDDGFGS